jgi:hypothetical protein
LNTGLEPRKDKLQTIPLLDFLNELVDGEVASHRCQQALDRSLVTVNVEQTTDDLRSANGVDTLNIDLNELG